MDRGVLALCVRNCDGRAGRVVWMALAVHEDSLDFFTGGTVTYVKSVLAGIVTAVLAVAIVVFATLRVSVSEGSDAMGPAGVTNARSNA